jgi:hypothetical protein
MTSRHQQLREHPPALELHPQSLALTYRVEGPAMVANLLLTASPLTLRAELYRRAAEDAEIRNAPR